MCSKCMTFNFWSMHCSISKIVLRYLLSYFTRTVAYASDLRKDISIDWSYCSSKPAEKV